MKKIITLITAFLMLFALAGCGDFKPPASNGNDPNEPTRPVDPDPGNPGDPDDPDDPTLDANAFSVTLVYNNAVYKPTESEKVVVLWTDEENGGVYSAEVGANGVASRNDLDGDYKVTLQSLPAGFTYDPNIYEAKNYNRHLRITLFKIVRDYGRVEMIEAPISSAQEILAAAKPLPGSGTFRVQLETSKQIAFFYYYPKVTGQYSVQSIADVTENKINPILDIYVGTFAWLPTTPTYTRDGGGNAENTFTKNFYWTTEVTSVGQGFYFGLRSTCIDENAYPLQLDFILDRDGDITGTGELNYRVVEPTEEFSEEGEPTSYESFKYVATLSPDGMTLDGSHFKLWRKGELSADGKMGDGYYHFFTPSYDQTTGEPLVDKETGEPIGTYGGKLYAVISKDSPVINAGAEGGDYSSPTSGSGFTNSDVRLKIAEGPYDKDPCDYGKFIAAYAEKTNNHGAYPVTEELRAFMMKYSISQSLFNDGEGFAEVHYKSSYNNQWLFNCGYYSIEAE